MDESAVQLEQLKSELSLKTEICKAEMAAQQQLWQEQAIRDRHAWLEKLEINRLSMRAVIEFALLTLRSLILVNGGASVGLITFIGNVTVKNYDIAHEKMMALSSGLASFVLGLILALVATGLSYLTQALFTELSKEIDPKSPAHISKENGPKPPAYRWGNIVRAGTVVTAVLSMVAFGYGAFLCREGFILK